MSRRNSEMKQGLLAYLQGYGQNNLDGLSAIARYSAWSALAMRECERRMARILESLPLDEVQAIAAREIHLDQLACQVLRALDKE